MILLIALFYNLVLLAIGWVCMSVGYFLVLKKMPLRKWTCAVPVLAEMELSRVLFSRRRSFFRPFVVAAVCMAGALYLGTRESMGWLFTIASALVYQIFLIRLYYRLGKSFGKKTLFNLGLVFFPVIFLPILGLGRSQYEGLTLKPLKQHSKAVRIINRIALVIVSAVEIIILVLGVTFFSYKNVPPKFLVSISIDPLEEQLKDIVADDEYISREVMMGDDVSCVLDTEPSREHFITDYSKAENVVVLSYIIGSNLENRSGLASVNIRQMKEATTQGNALKFVVQAGGSDRWFEDEIENGTYGRYEISGGEMRLVQELADPISMSEGESLSDFLIWAKDNYPADRYMLVLWDHGGGIMGYGMDDLIKKDDPEGSEIMSVQELVTAIDKSDIKFDLIGFDACLMQDIEIAAALEPYTDYYLASEEVEGGFGWYYTSPFGKLAADPTMSTEDMAKDLLSCYDQLNTIVNDGEKDIVATLSLVDTTLVKPAYDKLTDFLLESDSVMTKGPENFGAFAAAGSKAYTFTSEGQIDIIDFLEILKDSDFDDVYGTDEEIDEVIHSIQSSILYRNKNSAKNINGMAIAFPSTSIGQYDATREELDRLNLKDEYRIFDNYFSIIAVQKEKAKENEDYAKDELVELINSEGLNISDIFMYINESAADYTAEDWYVDNIRK